MNKNDYITSVNKKGDEGSEILIAECASTLRNRDEVEIINDGKNELAVLNVPHDKVAIIYTVSGDSDLLDPISHTKSMVQNAVKAAYEINAEPVVLADVVDSSTGDLDMIQDIANTLRDEANNAGIAIPTGENAILGNRVYCPANVIGTTIAFLDKDKISELTNNKTYMDSRFSKNHVNYSVHNVSGKKLMINSDGIGTKSDPYERAKKYEIGLEDLIAMQADDSAKDGARIIESSNIIETNGNIPYHIIENYAKQMEKKLGFRITLTEHKVGNRIKGYAPSMPTYNASGSTVSIVDEKRLLNPLIPFQGAKLLAVTPKITGPRSNGITLKRECLEDMFGPDWHTHPIGKEFLKFMTTPSTIFYKMFMELIDNDIAQSVYHNSGGAFNAKLAKPIAKHGLYVAIDGDKLFKPDWRESALVGKALYPAEKAYATFPMNNEAFIAVHPEKVDIAQKHIQNFYGFNTAEIGTFEYNKDGLTGITLKGIKGSDNKDVYYSGMD